MTSARSERPANCLLASLPKQEFDRIRPLLSTMTLGPKQVFLRHGQAIRDVFFPNAGVASITIASEGGKLVEVATVGREGFIGSSLLVGGRTAIGETMMQVPGDSVERMRASDFVIQLQRREALYDAVSRFALAERHLIMQTTACVALHSLPERCARWLLMAHDRVDGDRFKLSQEFLAMMLGCSRPTVTLIAGTLQKAGFISYVRGVITIIDRAGLEASCCECYETIRHRYSQLGLLSARRPAAAEHVRQRPRRVDRRD